MKRLFILLFMLTLYARAGAQTIQVGDRSRFAFASNTLLNGVLRRYDKSLLRIMRNAILASHGYVFRSKDLKAYFEAHPWYRPATNNAAVQLSLLEQLNVALIQAAERQQ